MNGIDKTIERLREFSNVNQGLIFPDYEKPVEKMVYDPNFILLGVNDEKKRIYLDMSKPERFLILGKTGAGKTFLESALMSRFAQSNYGIACLSDMKSEMGMMKKPANKFLDKFPNNEEPIGLEVSTCYPTFLSNKPRGEKDFQLSIQDFTLNDLLTLFQSESGSSDRTTALSSLFYDLKNGKIESFIGIEDWIKNSRFNASTRRSLSLSFKTIHKFGVIGDQHNHSFIDDINKNRIPVLSLRGYDESGDSAGFFPAYVGILTRNIKLAMEKSIITKRMLILYEELHVICPNLGDPSSKQPIMELLRMGRGIGTGISMGFVVQMRQAIPDEIFSQCRYIFLPHNADAVEVKEIFKRTHQEYVVSPTYLGNVVDEIRDMKWNKKTGDRQWMVIDRDTGTRETFWPYPPLAKLK